MITYIPTPAKKLHPVKCPQTRQAKLAKKPGRCIIISCKSAVR